MPEHTPRPEQSSRPAESRQPNSTPTAPDWRAVAKRYHTQDAHGWQFAIWHPKRGPQPGRTGRKGQPYTADALARAITARPQWNPIVRIPRGIIGIDCDIPKHPPKDTPENRRLWADIREDQRRQAGYAIGGRGPEWATALYRLPADQPEPDHTQWDGGEILVWYHRFQALGTHSTGAPYQLYRSGAPIDPLTDWPAIEDLPIIPADLYARLTSRPEREEDTEPRASTARQETQRDLHQPNRRTAPGKPDIFEQARALLPPISKQLNLRRSGHRTEGGRKLTDYKHPDATSARSASISEAETPQERIRFFSPNAIAADVDTTGRKSYDRLDIHLFNRNRTNSRENRAAAAQQISGARNPKTAAANGHHPNAPAPKEEQPPPPEAPPDGPEPTPKRMSKAERDALTRGKTLGQAIPRTTTAFYDGQWSEWQPDSRLWEPRTAAAIKRRIYEAAAIFQGLPNPDQVDGRRQNTPSMATAEVVRRPPGATEAEAHRRPVWDWTTGAPIPGIPWQDAIVDMDPRGKITTRPTSRKTFSTSGGIPHEWADGYQPDRDRTPLFDRFLRQSIRDEETAYWIPALIGRTLTADTGAHWMPVLFGPAASGKSTLARILRALTGPGATRAAASFRELGRRWTGDELRHARLLLLNDLARFDRRDHASQRGLALIKQILGQDSISAERKYRATVDTYQPALTVWSFTNHAPTWTTAAEDLEAMARRIRLIPTRAVPRRDQRPDLAARIIEQEGAAIARRAVHEWATHRAGKYPEPEEIGRSTRAMLLDGRPYAERWRANRIEITMNPADRTCREDLRADQTAYYFAQDWDPPDDAAQKRALRPLTRQTGMRTTYERGHPKEPAQHGIYRGLRLTNPPPEPCGTPTA